MIFECIFNENSDLAYSGVTGYLVIRNTHWAADIGQVTMVLFKEADIKYSVFLLEIHSAIERETME